MKIHPDWSDNGSVAVTFDDDGEESSETYKDFSKLLKHFNINFTTFKLRGSSTASMVIPVSSSAPEKAVCEERAHSISENTNTNEEHSETVDDESNTDGVVIKKKKKKSSSS